jgi:pimeloyl-ACP methyl ester carboxylesterase
VLGHGNAMTLDSWREWGYTDALKNDYKVVLIDARGHGKSDKPHTASAYRDKMADDVVAVLDSLEITRANFFGYSMGAMTGFSLATHHAERFHSFILGGMTPYEWPETMVRAVNESIHGYELLLTDPDAYLHWMENLLGHSLTPEERSEFLSRDAETSIGMQKAILDTPPLTDGDLSGITVPCLVFCGDLDPFHNGARKSVENMPRAAFISMTGFNHITAIMRSDLIVPYIKSFLAVVNSQRD